MIATTVPEPLYLPPLFTLHRVDRGAFDAACAQAGTAGAGALFLEERRGVLGIAVVFEPEEPLAAARRAFMVGMAAVTDALVAHCLPERSVRIGWPDVLVYDTGRIGGGRLAWEGVPATAVPATAVPEAAVPEAAVPEAAVPGWMVFGVELIADREDVAEPGRHPETVSLREEDFGESAGIVESFARNLMLRMNIWETQGFDAAADGYLSRLIPEVEGAAHALGPTGDLVVLDGGRVAARPLVPALAAGAVEARWRDRARGGPRL
jgi:hypothetical protein